MIFLHDSVKTDRFNKDKKLTLLKNGVITISQFVNLIEPKDDYVLIGPAVVAKSAIEDFIIEWKTHDLSLEKAISSTQTMRLSQDDIMDKLNELVKVFPEINKIVIEFKRALGMTSCPKCVKNRYLNVIANKVKTLMEDGRNVGDLQGFIGLMMEKYFPKRRSNAIGEELNMDWLKPDELLGLGEDIIEGLDACFECAMKHLSRAKILYEEAVLGYPDHKQLLFNELTLSDKAVEAAFIKYSDAVAQMDMASCELVGDLKGLSADYQTDIVELANSIRAARLALQDDPMQVPDFDELRITVKKLQLKVAGNK